MRSPSLRSSRVSSAGSAAAPKASPLRANNAGSGRSGSAVDCAEQRIRAVNGLDLDQCGPPVIVRAMVGSAADDRHLAVRIKKRLLLAARLALHQRESKIASEDRAAGSGEAVGQALGHRPDPGDRHDAKHDAGDENAEAAQAAAQLAPGDNAARARSFILCRSLLPRGRAGGGSDPSRMHVQHPIAMGASAVSWVTSTSVLPRSRWPRNRSSMMSAPVASSRLPVGSSATTIAGLGASARAIATRCCSPPESSVG